jgi:hypothetical protein
VPCFGQILLLTVVVVLFLYEVCGARLPSKLQQSSNNAADLERGTGLIEQAIAIIFGWFTIAFRF